MTVPCTPPFPMPKNRKFRGLNCAEALVLWEKIWYNREGFGCIPAPSDRELSAALCRAAKPHGSVAMKILNFGSCNLDFVYSVEHIVRPGETQSASERKTFPGGKGLNQSIAIARAGAQVFHAGCVGTDGDILREVLAESGVDLTYLSTVDSPNGHAVIQVSAKGENSIFLYAGSNAMVSREIVDEVLSHFDEGDILLLQNEISNVPYIIEQAYKKRMQIIFNPSPFTEELREIDLNRLSYVILNEVEARDIAGVEDPRAILAYFRATYPDLRVMLTLGKEGSVYSDRDCEIRQEIYPADVVDTTAAGDTFTGYFVAGIAAGEDYASILRTATAASSIAVSRAGAAPSIPCKQEVLAHFSLT